MRPLWLPLAAILLACGLAHGEGTPAGSAAAAALAQGGGPQHAPRKQLPHSGRCIGATGSWCGSYYSQAAVPHRPPPVHGARCPGDCSGVGVCHGDRGVCDCPAGWGGPACADPLKRPCTRRYRIPRNSSVPNSHIGPDKRDLDWLAPGSTYSRCAGICDDDIAACYCDPKLGNPKHGRIPAPPGSPPGTPPVQEGRQLFEPCSRLADDGKGHSLDWVGWGVAFEKIYGPNGWCVADEPQVPECRCDLDGSGGPGCNLRSEMFCPNQCSGRGRCNLGFCVCDAGWWGLDCAHAATAEAARAPPPALAPWLRDLAVDAWRCGSGGGGCLEEMTAAAERTVRGSANSAGGAGGGGGGTDAGGSAQGAAAAAASDRDGGSGLGPEDDDAFGSAGADYGAGVGAMPLPRAPPPPPPPPPLQLAQASPQAQQLPAAGTGVQADAAPSEDPFGGLVDAWASSAGPGGRRRRRQLRASRLRQLRQQRAPGPDPQTPHADTDADAGADGGAASGKGGGAGLQGRLRPLVYVYDVPSTYAGRMLQYRLYKESCAWRWFDAEYDNATLTSPYPYGAEPLLLELLLGSRHRTLDPEEADFFYVPLMATCWFHPVSGWADYPWWYVDTWSRVSHAAVMTQALLDWVKTAHPYWNRTGGADHVWLFAHDEGACWAPREVYERSIILTHWGRMDPDHESGTSYGQDNYTADVTDDPFLPRGYTHLIKGHPCYTPGKDLVIPLFRGPDRYHASPYMGRPQPARDILLFHRGRMGLNDPPAFSRGVRQRIANLSREHDWARRFSIHVGGYDELPGDYSELLSRSVFCLVAAGDGWSARFDDAMLHGCIPVIVIDKVVGPWGHQLRWSAFSVRVAEADVGRLPEILQAVPPDRVARMQRAAAAVWRRFAWLSHPVLVRGAGELLEANARAAAAAAVNGAINATGSVQPQQQAQQAGWLRPGAWRDDAFHTILQWLHHKLAQREAGSAGARPRHQRPARHHHRAGWGGGDAEGDGGKGSVV
ncbi:exostosin-like glycosyltransferase [Raphidocelis subcapitata]|uniref:Exostosin-like glycosyltransferase n=1 Tax=Raphidocelis subcapitata TaxID=307507 RepID=A0A2V0PAU5_9CHLO|nr:exostosin-like glycosyltransferase [Raphidocelis subcapitata]|eukprot:GBF96649.1 exostosin-like glycosyltransferase [Raphidocelis subcapitata]